MLELGLIESIDDDADIYNHFRNDRGLDPHKSYGYLMHRAVAGRVADWISASG